MPTLFGILLSINQILGSALLFGIFLWAITHTYYFLSRKAAVKLDYYSFVVIVGACTGIGKDMLKQLLIEYNCKILVIDFRKDLFQSVNAQLQTFSKGCQFFYCDLSKVEQVNNCIYHLKQRKQQIDLFIYNAGIMNMKVYEQQTDQDIMQIFQIHYLSPIKMIRQLYTNLEHGHFCFTSSIIPIMPALPMTSLYASSKNAITVYLHTFQQQLYKSGYDLTISIACPSVVETNMTKGLKNTYSNYMGNMKSNQAAKIILDGFISRKQIIFIPRILSFIYRVAFVFPSEISHWFEQLYDIKNLQQVKQRIQSQRKQLKQQLLSQN